MALKLFVHDTATGSCELAGLLPYPTVSTTDPTVTVTPVVDSTTGQIDYQLEVEHTVDINVENFAYNSTTKDITITETDGDTHTINVADLLDNVSSTMTQVVTTGNIVAKHDNGEGTVVDVLETITELVQDGAGIKYTNEAGTSAVVTFCDLASSLPDNGTTVGG